MFQNYFSKKNDQIMKAYTKTGTGAGKGKKPNREAIVKPIREFFSEHLANYFDVTSGSALDSFGHLVENIDILVYYPFHSKMWEMMNKSAVVEHIFGGIFVIPKVTTDELNQALRKIISFKQLSSRKQIGEGENQRKIPCAIIGLETTLSYAQLKDYLVNYYKNNEILNAYEVDFIGVLNHSMIIKDWHNKEKSYSAIETKKDTLMWLFILFQEYILGSESSNLGFSYREYIKNPEKYNEY